ncbi:hypothetical protein CUN67_19990 [Pantoea cypripedii]|uniref:Uncharacterized protein n=1 Tax=Pantoea cypripedii TaxID=55209 RepID=A0A6B9GDI9_PANCY|nr:hypothetical protein CUN67_19990 [Pantoea cypripedii]
MPQPRWLPSLTRVTELSQLPGILSVAAWLQHEIRRIFHRIKRCSTAQTLPGAESCERGRFQTYAVRCTRR